MAIEYISVTGKNKWIRNTNQLPEKTKDYLVFIENYHGQKIGMGIAGWSQSMRAWILTDPGLIVTHWQELPDPPEFL